MVIRAKTSCLEVLIQKKRAIIYKGEMSDGRESPRDFNAIEGPINMSFVDEVIQSFRHKKE